MKWNGMEQTRTIEECICPSKGNEKGSGRLGGTGSTIGKCGRSDSWAGYKNCR